MTTVSYNAAMKILVTSGGTREDIDPVRSIVNNSTGRLGSLIADRFIEGGARVTYICGENALLPKLNAHVIRIRNGAQLLEKIEQVLYACSYDCVIHSMAVSDYTPANPSATKISSDEPQLVLVLKRQPKIIQRIKEIQPDTVLVGFKLLAGASENELVSAANRLMESSRCDYVLANDLDNIHGDYHKAVLINKDGIIGRRESKEEIAEMIYNEVKT